MKNTSISFREGKRRVLNPTEVASIDSSVAEAIKKLEYYYDECGQPLSLGDIVRFPLRTRIYINNQGKNRPDIALAIEELKESMLYPSNFVYSLDDKGEYLEMDNEKADTYTFDEVYKALKSEFNFKYDVILGYDNEGEIIAPRLRSLGHTYIGGSTGSGKSILLHSIIDSLVSSCTPNEVKFVLVDPKRVEFSLYKKLPHLLCPIINDAPQFHECLSRLENLANERLSILKDTLCPSIDRYNLESKNIDGRKLLPYIVVVIDEILDMVELNGGSFDPLDKLIRNAKKAGIIIIMATQIPQYVFLPYDIEICIDTRIGMWLRNRVDSISVIQRPDAEKLRGHGDMLIAFKEKREEEPIRAQCPYVSPNETRRIVEGAMKKYNATQDPRFLDLTPAPDPVKEIYPKVVRSLKSQDYITVVKIQLDFSAG